MLRIFKRRTWKAYAQNIPAPCSLAHDGRIAYIPAATLLAADPSAAGSEQLAVRLKPHTNAGAVAGAIGSNAAPSTGAVGRGSPDVAFLDVGETTTTDSVLLELPDLSAGECHMSSTTETTPHSRMPEKKFPTSTPRFLPGSRWRKSRWLLLAR